MKNIIPIQIMAVFLNVELPTIQPAMPQKPMIGRYKYLSAMIFPMGIMPSTGSSAMKNHRQKKNRSLFTL
jgi:hypothetical protein